MRQRQYDADMGDSSRLVNKQSQSKIGGLAKGTQTQHDAMLYTAL